MRGALIAVLALAVIASILSLMSGDDQFNWLTVRVNYDLSLEEQAKQFFDEISPDINAGTFFETRNGQATLYMKPIRFGVKGLTTKELIDTLATMGTRPATAIEMSAYFDRLGRWPLRKGLSLVALGSEGLSSDLRRIYPCANSVTDRKGLVAISCDIWRDNYLFLVVSK